MYTYIFLEGYVQNIGTTFILKKSHCENHTKMTFAATPFPNFPRVKKKNLANSK